MKKLIYLDNAATTPVESRVFAAMKPYFSLKYGNPSEFHLLGQEARKAVEESRRKIASFLGAKAEEIVFTSCASESINFSHKGLIEALRHFAPKSFTPHIITSAIEHKAVLETCQHLENSGLAKVTYLPVDQYGLVKVTDLEKAIHTILVSIMYVNNEVGTIQPIAEIGQLLKKVNEQKTKNHQPRTYFHTDATQAIQYLDCQVEKLGVDMLSLTGHKFYAPKGIGALYIKKGTPIRKQQDGGGQEMKLRSGTENVPYIVGLGEAIELISEVKDGQHQKLTELRERLITNILKIPEVYLTGHPQKRVPHIASFVIKGAEGESLILLLSDKKVIASSGSACTSQVLQPSHVLTAMGVAAEVSHGSVRFSLGKNTTIEEIDYVSQILPKIISRLREMAPQI